MSSEDPPPPDTDIADFAEILMPQGGESPPVIVGGHAVGLWSRYYLLKGVAELTRFLPFRSKDLDVVGTVELLNRLQRRFNGVLLRSEPRSPVFGRLEIPRKDGSILRIEVLHTVLGLDSGDLARTIDLQAGDVIGRVPMPHLVLKAKIANAAMLDQEGRQDVKHVRMMMLCVHAFIKELLENLGTGEITERAVVNVLEEVREILTSPMADKAAVSSGFDFTTVWPIEALKNAGAGKIDRWVAHRLP